MRGKQRRSEGGRDIPRITPAGAGKTPSCDGRPPEYEDHPRRCGENSGTNPTKARHLGSPPQVRGKQQLYNVDFRFFRITPAGAGKTSYLYNSPVSGTDHPRRCGENAVRQPLKYLMVGSPPQVRGKPLSSGTALGLCRITPAGAGKT